MIISSRPSHPALGDPSGNALALFVRISRMTFMPAEVRGGRLLPSCSGSVWTVENDYTGLGRAQPWPLWFSGVERVQHCLSDPNTAEKSGDKWSQPCLFLLPTTNAS